MQYMLQSDWLRLCKKCSRSSSSSCACGQVLYVQCSCVCVCVPGWYIMQMCFGEEKAMRIESQDEVRNAYKMNGMDQSQIIAKLMPIHIENEIERLLCDSIQFAS